MYYHTVICLAMIIFPGSISLKSSPHEGHQDSRQPFQNRYVYFACQERGDRQLSAFRVLFICGQGVVRAL